MSIDVEYAIKTNVRNNLVVREVDTRQKREFARVVCLAALLVGMVLFSAWQHFRTVSDGYAIERLRVSLSDEQRINRQLRLNLETLEAPQVIEQRARQLGLGPASSDDTLVVARVPTAPPPTGVVAQAR